jgi:hypothetical protein
LSIEQRGNATGYCCGKRNGYQDQKIIVKAEKDARQSGNDQ